nr:DNA-directed RNA polymerases IV and V subunit 4 [Ipomoea batatas]
MIIIEYTFNLRLSSGIIVLQSILMASNDRSDASSERTISTGLIAPAAAPVSLALVTIAQLSDHLLAQQFIATDDFSPANTIDGDAVDGMPGLDSTTTKKGKLASRKVDPNVARELLASAVIKHDLPFSFVEYDGIRKWQKYLNPDVPSSAKGKDDSSGKTKRGRKVQFDSDDSLDGSFMKSNGKADKPVGEGDKVGKSGKGQTAKAPTPLELRVEQEIFGNTKCVLDCEAAEILQGIQERMVVLSEDPTLKLPVWMCLIANFHLESVDEVFALVPSLKGKKNKVEEPLKNVLEELAKLKKSS